ncbi:hypothetical protein H310_12028 [Aphanomyces invadans]|uniref:Uncharacterized protein n=1 Tax=Aphanomyces invadans TaxID=157072 RepID=A0A024TK60_9STRA|nr:hypothetical protein H310_12028 [Aphanomyces invadans]ETV94393.1 hypothetical protein H310_12028 [Aphanomyces invadans]|eukprot:XP_008877156.1 hypothetical protein H310_12028 [Aphanomyces invadans]
MAGGFVEFHRSMSLEHQALPPPPPAKTQREGVAPRESHPTSPWHAQPLPSTVDQVLHYRDELWKYVDEILRDIGGHADTNSEMASAIDKTKQLKKLHAICHAREQHVHTVKLGLLHERNEYLAKLVALQSLLTSRSSPMDTTTRENLLQIVTKQMSP